ncbi:para-aminobenzoate synthase, partial [Periconia macrospinosa]
WLSDELGIKTMISVGKDVYIIVLARFLRMFGYSAVALILALYFEELGFSDSSIGLFMTLTLLGDVCISLLLTLVADALGRRIIMFLGAVAMAVSGAVFALTSNYVALLMAAILGVISPTGNEIGPFKAVEESTLAHLIPESKRADVFTWYVVMAVLGTSSGLVVGGQIIDRLLALESWSTADALRFVFWIYTGVGCGKAFLTMFLSRKCERNDKPNGDETEPLLNGHEDTDSLPNQTSEQTASEESTRETSKDSTRRNRNPISRISKPTRWILLKLCSLFFLDSLGSGMVPFSLINFYLDRKFQLEKGKLGGIMSATWTISTIGNVFASSVAKRLGLIPAMVVTHLPSSVFLALLPAPAGLPWTICLLVARAILNSMDQAPRSAFLSMVVKPEELTAVMGVINILKILSQSGGPWITGLLADRKLFWVAFVVAGSLKGAYDVLLLMLFAGQVRTSESEGPNVETETDREDESGGSGMSTSKILAPSSASPNCCGNSPKSGKFPIRHSLLKQSSLLTLTTLQLCPPSPILSVTNGHAQPDMARAIFGTRPRVLYLDAYDSFSNNIVAQIEKCLDVQVTKCSIDAVEICPQYEASSEFRQYLKEFDAVVAGPGPGWAKCDKDVGLMKELWKLQHDDLLPVFGICLGFQSMCLAFGADIQRLNEPRHGLISDILHNRESIFEGVGHLSATQYHSLQVMIEHRMQTKRSVRYPGELWEPTEVCPQIKPLAWDFDNKRNGAVLMAAKHTSKPFWGVQFHPESICTNEEGTRLIENWWREAQVWKRERVGSRGLNASPRELCAKDSLPPSGPEDSTDARHNSGLTPEEMVSLISTGDGESIQGLPPTTVHCATIGSGRLTVADIVEHFDIQRNEAIVLESGLQPDLIPAKVGTGRYSIIGLLIPEETLRIHYFAATRTIRIVDGRGKVHREWQTADFWQWIKEFMSCLRGTLQHLPTTPTWAPFWGGLMGYASYEAGLQTIGVEPDESSACPDVCFAYITRSIVVDHQLKKVYVQSIRGEDDKTWVGNAWDQIYDAGARKSIESTPSTTPMPKPNPFERDTTLNTYLASCEQFVVTKEDYCASVAACQEVIADGQSYELCLTTANQIRARKPRICRLSTAEDNELSWKLYKRLSSQNPAPFSAYMRVHNVHILSSSPERFISWDRSQSAQCRPIKGTVAKKPSVDAETAHAILSSSKERAENLMIVDLVRHQLHGVYGSGNVHVRQLMQVEEYETLWQLVSVIDAIPPTANRKPQTPDEWDEPNDYVSAAKNPNQNMEYFGYDAFVQSLPPGSMTGAPKKRSCELLATLESSNQQQQHRRGIYSGVLGYLDIGGAGDFSVVIRTAVKIDSSSSTSQEEDEWTISAGGAITAQSDLGSEYAEMLNKFNSTAQTF